MRASAAVLVLLMLSGAAFAQQKSTDYSPDTLLRLFTEAGTEEEDRAMVRYRLGTVEFRALGTSWRIAYLPMLVPLSGTRFGSTATYQEFPDPFVLTNTPIAMPQRAWRTRREINAELRRIERTEREKARVTVKVGGQ